MKILLREYGNRPYVWETAKYNGDYFIINGELIEEYNIVSVINDNRKNYVKCSSCGKIFPKSGDKFKKHQDAASGINPCLTCRKLKASELRNGATKYTRNNDGTYTQKRETQVRLFCKNYYWSEYPIESEEAIVTCRLRQCGDAHKVEISDTFTKYPGIFDDIITVDKILDNGYECIGYSNSTLTEYVLNSELGISAWVNNLGIVDRFALNSGCGWAYHVYYSKKYNEFYDTDDRGRYAIWNPKMDNDIKDKFKELIMSLYK